MRNAVFLVLVGCSSSVAGPEEVPLVLDGGSADSAMIADGGTPELDSGTPKLDSGPAATDSGPVLQPGECRPWRNGPESVSHQDCAPYLDRPVCDAHLKRCVAPPSGICGACQTDEQCQHAQPGSRCVFTTPVWASGSSQWVGGDSACMWPCALGCDWLEERWGEVLQVQCTTDGPDESVCLPTRWIPPFSCSDRHGGRLE